MTENLFFQDELDERKVYQYYCDIAMTLAACLFIVIIGNNWSPSTLFKSIVSTRTILGLLLTSVPSRTALSW